MAELKRMCTDFCDTCLEYIADQYFWSFFY